jgi:hypothetical protein
MNVWLLRKWHAPVVWLAEPSNMRKAIRIRAERERPAKVHNHLHLHITAAEAAQLVARQRALYAGESPEHPRGVSS